MLDGGDWVRVDADDPDLCFDDDDEATPWDAVQTKHQRLRAQRLGRTFPLDLRAEDWWFCTLAQRNRGDHIKKLELDVLLIRAHWFVGTVGQLGRGFVLLVDSKVAPVGAASGRSSPTAAKGREQLPAAPAGAQKARSLGHCVRNSPSLPADTVGI